MLEKINVNQDEWTMIDSLGAYPKKTWSATKMLPPQCSRRGVPIREQLLHWFRELQELGFAVSMAAGSATCYDQMDPDGGNSHIQHQPFFYKGTYRIQVPGTRGLTPLVTFKEKRHSWPQIWDKNCLFKGLLERFRTAIPNLNDRYQSLWPTRCWRLSLGSSPYCQKHHYVSVIIYLHLSTSGWWFGTCFIGPSIWNNQPNWLSYFSEGFKPPTRLDFCWRIVIFPLVYPPDMGNPLRLLQEPPKTVVTPDEMAGSGRVKYGHWFRNDPNGDQKTLRGISPSIW